MNTATSRAGGVAALAFAALALRLLVVAGVGFNPSFFDADGYHGLALEGLRGMPVPTDGHPPGYTWFLEGIYRVAGPRPRIVYLVQALLSSIAVFFVGDAARLRYGARAGLFAATLLALSGYLAFAPTLLTSETVCLFGIALLIWILLPGWPRITTARWLMAAAVISMLALVRTSFLGLGAFLAVLPLVGRGGSARLRQRLVVAATAALLSFTPIVLYARLRARRTGVFRLGSAADVFCLWQGNNPNATGRAEDFADAPRISTETPDMEAIARAVTPRVKRFVLEHPFRQLELFAKRASYNFAPAKRDLVYLYACGWAGERPALLVEIAYGWVALSVPLLGGAALLAFARRGDDGAHRLAWGLFFVAILPYQLAIGDARYLHPLHPLLAFAAAASLSVGRAEAWTRKRRVFAAAAAVLFFGNAAFDVWKQMPRSGPWPHAEDRT